MRITARAVGAASCLLLIGALGCDSVWSPADDSRSVSTTREIRHFERLGDPNTTDDQFALSLSAVSESVVVESPEEWMALINSPDLSDQRRTGCLAEFFRRHIHKGMPLSEALQLPGVLTWWTADVTCRATHHNVLPNEIDRSREGDVFCLQPDFLERTHSAIYISFVETCAWDEFRDIIEGRSDKDLTIDEVGYGIYLQ
jgi:hypothetical protein